MHGRQAVGGGQSLLPGLRSLLEDDPDVVALGVFGSVIGSGGSARQDDWSDLDAVVALREGALPRFFPGTAWLAPLGPPFAREQSAGEHTSTLRLCFADFRRLDLVLTTDRALAVVQRWPRVPFWGGCRVLFSRDEQVRLSLQGRYAPPPPGALSAEAFDTMQEGFWFKATQAVVKVVRGDRLIALHLALDLLSEVCVLEMLLRDRVTGTSVHRQGGRGNDFVSRLQGLPAGCEGPAILDLVAECATLFDHLGSEWSAAYAPRGARLVGWIERARTALPSAP
jgi:hypothetical protein